MKFVKVERHTDPYGFDLNALDSQKESPRLRPALPPCAWDFASDPKHYDFHAVLRQESEDGAEHAWSTMDPSPWPLNSTPTDGRMTAGSGFGTAM